MTTITIKINERTKAGRALKDLIELFSKEHKGVEIISDDKKTSYNEEFVEKIKKAEEDIKKGKTTRLDPENIWESIL